MSKIEDLIEVREELMDLAGLMLIICVCLLFGFLVVGGIAAAYIEAKNYNEFMEGCLSNGNQKYECIAMWRN